MLIPVIISLDFLLDLSTNANYFSESSTTVEKLSICFLLIWSYVCELNYFCLFTVGRGLGVGIKRCP